MRVRSHRASLIRPTALRADPDYTLSEEQVPESRPHDLTIDLLKGLLAAWVLRSGRRAQVGRNLAIRWDPERPKYGVDPDIYVVEPPPPEGDEVTSLLLWQSGHFPPLLAVEIVSANSPRKDYTLAPEKYALSGVTELWIFDPALAGPPSLGPHRLQIWRRDADGQFVRVYAGEGPAYAESVGGWLFAVDEGQRLRIAEDEAGTRWWKTSEESERAAKEEAYRLLESERADKERALARVAALEAELARRSRAL